MANEVYLPGWKGARLAVYTGSAYMPIACITSRSESNATETTEKSNVCTEGKTVTRANSITRTVSIEGEVADDNSLDDLRELQDSLEEQTFRVYRGSATETPIYFKAIITNLDADYPAGESEDATFSMDLNINGEYLTADPNA